MRRCGIRSSPDRFCNGRPDRNGKDILPWQTGPVTNYEKYGGDLEEYG